MSYTGDPTHIHRHDELRGKSFFPVPDGGSPYLEGIDYEDWLIGMAIPAAVNICIEAAKIESLIDFCPDKLGFQVAKLSISIARQIIWQRTKDCSFPSDD